MFLCCGAQAQEHFCEVFICLHSSIVIMPENVKLHKATISYTTLLLRYVNQDSVSI
jgi:hypothetical protein